ncbi:MAG TPA: DUF6370 family protein [Vicinamibacterales bacterium]|nr:DUF6370 family protein [Vicinamibacterales bacterium]
MKKVSLFVGFCVALALCSVAGSNAATEEVTLSGTIMCAKCSLKKADAKECQDVLVTKDESGKLGEYYIAANDVSKKFGHTCKGEAAATVTGEVSEKDGKKWIVVSKMEKTKQ